MDDLLGIKLHLELDGKKEVISDLQTLVKQLQSMGIKVDVGLDNKKAEKQAQQFKSRITEVLKSTKINPEINQQAFTDLQKRLSKVRAEVDSLAKIDIKTDSNNNIEKAVLTYKNGMGQVVTETMAWKTAVDSVANTMTKTFGTQSLKYSDDIAKQAKDIDKLSDSYQKAKKAQDNMIASANQLRQISRTDMDTQSIDRFIQKLSGVDTHGENARLELDLLGREFNTLSTSIKNTNTQLDLIGNIKNKISSLDSLVSGKGKYNVSSYDNIRSSYEKLIEEINSGNISIGQAKAKFNSLNAELNNFRATTKATSSTAKTLVDSINKFFHFNLAIEALQLLRRGFRETIQIVYELDSSLLELSKVSELTSTQLSKVTDRAYSMGQTLAKTGTEVINAVTTFKRGGFNLEDSFTLGEDALVLTSVAEGIKNVEDASSSLISVLRGYKMEVKDATHIVDAFNEVSNTQAVNFDDLVDGAQRISGVMAQKGNSFEEMLGMITGGTEVLRNVEKVSTGLQTISMRLAGMSEEGDKLDPEIVSTMTDEFERLAGISFVDGNGQLRDTYDILADMAKVMPNLDRNTQSYLMELASGKRQANVLQAIIDNWENVEKATESAKNSTGSSTKEFEKYLESLEGKTNQVKSTFQELVTGFITSDMSKGVLDLTNNVLKLINSLGGLTPLLTVIGGSFLFKNVGGAKCCPHNTPTPIYFLCEV